MSTICMILLSYSCDNKSTESKDNQKDTISTSTINNQVAPTIVFPALPDYDTTQWTEIFDDAYYALDLRYATSDNFMDQQIYDCGRCFLEKDTKRRLDSVAIELRKEGYRLLLFDCFRPLPFQQKLWDIKPSANYVTPPWKGSMHNRGLAIDLSLEDSTGTQVDMGTSFDFFGPKAHSMYQGLPKKIIENRKRLRSAMKKHGFTGIRTEWWHFSNKNVTSELSEWQWSCDEYFN